jgi:hypothetical protein
MWWQKYRIVLYLSQISPPNRRTRVKNLNQASLIILLAVFYFAGVYFAVSALVPALAFQTALVAVIGAMVTYRILGITGSDRPGAPLAILILTPIVCVAAGLVWWVMRLLGFWEIQ